MVQQTEQLSKIMRSHAEELNSGPLHRLTMMIKDKQQVKRSYQTIHQQIESELNKVSALRVGLNNIQNKIQFQRFHHDPNARTPKQSVLC